MSVALYASSRHDKPHARLYDDDLKHPAWKSLSGAAFKLVSSLMASYRPAKPNSFPVGRKTVAELVDVSEKTAAKIVDELIEKGHLREERKGSNRGCVKTRERIVSLTRFDTEMHAGDPALPKSVWKAQQARQNLPVGRRKYSGSEKNSINQNGSDEGGEEVLFD